MPEVFVLVGSHVRLDRGGLSATAPRTVENLLRLCGEWAAEVGWSLGADPRSADGVVVGPGITPPPLNAPVGQVQPGQGIDGFRWAIRHVAFTRDSPPELVRYGAGADHVADVRHPEAPARGTAVLLHGGFWMDAWRRDLMDGLAIDLARRGWTTWNAEYRRVGAGGGWPATGKDVLAVVDAALAGLATEPVVLVGHSAGAQLALWAAGRRREQLARVVSLAGICDLDAAARQELGAGAALRFLGGEPPEDASPLALVPIGVPVLLAHMAGDAVVPAEHSRRFAAAAGAGDRIDYLEIEGGDHMALIDPASEAWARVAERL